MEIFRNSLEMIQISEPPEIPSPPAFERGRGLRVEQGQIEEGVGENAGAMACRMRVNDAMAKKKAKFRVAPFRETTHKIELLDIGSHLQDSRCFCAVFRAKTRVLRRKSHRAAIWNAIFARYCHSSEGTVNSNE